MSYRDAAGQPAGYAVALCQEIADSVKTQLQLPALAIEWVAVSSAAAVADVRQGKVDLLCAAERATLAQRRDVSFSEPIFLGGIAGLISTSAPREFEHILENRPPPYRPTWRGTIPTIMQHRTMSAISGTAAVPWLAERITTFRLITTLTTEESYANGITNVANGNSDALFGEHAQLLAQMKQHPDAGKVKILARHFTYEPQALALPRNDDDFRLAVDRALAGFIATPKFGELYVATFGAADDYTIEFFRGMPR
jgi:polar amino acid transport system substrate-binding protein